MPKPPASAALSSRWGYRAPLAIAATLAACGLGPRLAERQREQLAERLASRALQSSTGGARSAIRELMQLDVAGAAPLVRLAAVQRPEVAAAAQAAVLDQLAAWQVEFDHRRDGGRLALQLQTLAAALRRHAPQLGPEGRRWAQQVSAELLAASGPMPPEASWPVLACCEALLSLPVEPATTEPPLLAATANRALPIGPAAAPTTAPADGALGVAQSVDAIADHLPPTAGPAGGERVDPSAGAADLAVVLPPASASPTTPAASAAVSAENLLRPKDPPIEPTPAAAAAPTAAPDDRAAAAATRAAAHPVDVPSPQEQRYLVRRLRRLDDRQLMALLDSASRYEAAAARRILDQRGYSAEAVRTIHQLERLPPAERRAALDRATALPPAEARRLLRRFVTDADPDVRLQALAKLATTGDPQLEEIARQRAVEDDDPRVAELASKLLELVR